MSQRELSHEEQTIAAYTQDARIQCVKCAHERSRKKPPTLSISVQSDRNLYQCHHCGYSGCVSTKTPLATYHFTKQKPANITRIPTQININEQAIIDFFKNRGVTIPDMALMPQMTTGKKYYHDKGELDSIGFVYGPAGAHNAIKWRPIDGSKAFTQTGGAREFYGLEKLKQEDTTLVIVEGECDQVALASIGIRGVSVPNGAPKTVSKGKISPEDDSKFAYLWDARKMLESKTKIIIATDQDEAGDALAEEIARRVGRAKCWRTKYPEGCKDITDVLKKHGEVVASTTVNKSEPMPLVGVYSAESYTDQLLDLYENGTGKGESTGYPVVDELFTVKEGMLTVVTGVPSCLHGETRVQMDGGAWVPIKNISQGDKVVSFKAGEKTIDGVKEVWMSGEKECFTLKTRRGTEVIATKDHRFMTFDGWKKLSDIVVGDMVAKPRELAVERGVNGVSVSEAILLAVWLAEGVKTTSCFRFSNGSKKIIDSIRSAAEICGFELTDYSDKYSYGLKAIMPFIDKEHERKHRAKMRYHLKKQSGEIDVEEELEKRILSRKNTTAKESPGEFLTRMGVHDACTTFNMRIPERVFTSSSDVVSEFIGHLFACDGSASGNTFEYSTSSKRFALDLQLLLLRFGIQSFVRMKKTPRADSYPLSISDPENKKRFIDHVFVPGKNETFIEVAKDHSKGPFNTYDVVPSSVIKKLEHGHKYYKKHCGHGINRRASGGKNRGFISLFAKHDQNEWAMERCSRDLRWDTVVSIEPYGLVETYDMETEVCHNFVAEGVITHNSGKSEFIDQIMINMSRDKHWKWAVASFENPPKMHLAKMAEKLIGKPFFSGPNPRLSKPELAQALEFINEHFVFLESKDGEMSTIDSILDRAKQAVMRLGIRGLLVDPYNWIAMPRGVDETSAISVMLSKVTAFNSAYDVHTFFVAHPTKLYPNQDGIYPIPNGQSISGSAAWFAKADNGITVHRGENNMVEIHCWKVRYKWIGQQGMTFLGYDVPTGRYYEKSRLELHRAFEGTVNKSPAKEKIDLTTVEF